jgi:hypothetical protein
MIESVTAARAGGGAGLGGVVVVAGAAGCEHATRRHTKNRANFMPRTLPDRGRFVVMALVTAVRVVRGGSRGDGRRWLNNRR